MQSADYGTDFYIGQNSAAMLHGIDDAAVTAAAYQHAVGGQQRLFFGNSVGNGTLYIVKKSAAGIFKTFT